MKIDAKNLPAECWHMDRSMVRAGRKPVRVVPSSTTHWADGSVAGVRSGKRETHYSADALFETEAEALAWAQDCAAREVAWEQEKFDLIKHRITVGFVAYHKRAEALKAQAQTKEPTA